LKISLEVLQKLKIECPHCPDIPLLVIYPEDSKSVYYRDTHISMFVLALFTIAKILSQSTCPSADEWTKKM
jgi:hypothetical protein